MPNDASNSPPEKRQYPRISIPLLVEIKHPILGTRRCIASNASANGLFVELDGTQEDAGATRAIKENSRVKVSLLNTNQVEPHATPTVDMVVARIESNGLGLKFANQTSRFLWESAERRRIELAIGRDYFQVHVSAVVSRDHRLLLLERKGRWVFPGFFLTVGQPWRQTIESQLEQELGLDGIELRGPIDVSDTQLEDVPEVATLRVFMHFTTGSHKARLSEDSDYREQRWVDRARTLNDLTFASEEDRAVARTLFSQLAEHKR